MAGIDSDLVRDLVKDPYRLDFLERILRNTAVDEVYIAGNTLKQGESMQAAIKLAERFVSDLFSREP